MHAHPEAGLAGQNVVLDAVRGAGRDTVQGVVLETDPGAPAAGHEVRRDGFENRQVEIDVGHQGGQGEGPARLEFRTGEGGGVQVGHAVGEFELKAGPAVLVAVIHAQGAAGKIAVFEGVRGRVGDRLEVGVGELGHPQPDGEIGAVLLGLGLALAAPEQGGEDHEQAKKTHGCLVVGGVRTRSVRRKRKNYNINRGSAVGSQRERGLQEKERALRRTQSP